MSTIGQRFEQAVREYLHLPDNQPLNLGNVDAYAVVGPSVEFRQYAEQIRAAYASSDPEVVSIRDQFVGGMRADGLDALLKAHQHSQIRSLLTQVRPRPAAVPSKEQNLENLSPDELKDFFLFWFRSLSDSHPQVYYAGGEKHVWYPVPLFYDKSAIVFSLEGNELQARLLISNKESISQYFGSFPEIGGKKDASHVPPLTATLSSRNLSWVQLFEKAMKWDFEKASIILKAQRVQNKVALVITIQKNPPETYGMDLYFEDYIKPFLTSRKPAATDIITPEFLNGLDTPTLEAFFVYWFENTGKDTEHFQVRRHPSTNQKYIVSKGVRHREVYMMRDGRLRRVFVFQQRPLPKGSSETEWEAAILKAFNTPEVRGVESFAKFFSPAGVMYDAASAKISHCTFTEEGYVERSGKTGATARERSIFFDTGHLSRATFESWLKTKRASSPKGRQTEILNPQFSGLPVCGWTSNCTVTLNIRKITDESGVRYELLGVKVRGADLASDLLRINGADISAFPCPISLGASIQVGYGYQKARLEYEESGQLIWSDEMALGLDPAVEWKSRLIKDLKIEDGTVSATLNPQEGLLDDLTIEIMKTTDKLTGSVTYQISKVTKRGVVLSALAGRDLSVNENVVLDGDTDDYWESVIIRFDGQKVFIDEQKFESKKGHPLSVEVDDVFDLELKEARNFRTGERRIASAELKSKMDLMPFADHGIFDAEAAFESQGVSGNVLVFNHPSLGTIRVPIEPVDQTYVAVRDPLDPALSGAKLGSSNPDLDSQPTSSSLLSFNLRSYPSRAYRRDGVMSRRYLLAPDQISLFLDWMKLLGRRVDFDSSKTDQSLEVRFSPSGEVAFHSTALNADGSPRISGVDLTEEEYRVWDELQRGLERMGAGSPRAEGISAVWPVPEVGALLDIVRGDDFVQTPESIKRVAALFSQQPLTLKPGDVLPEDTYEIECRRTGLVIRLPSQFFGRLDPEGEGRARAPIRFLEQASLPYYYRGHENDVRPLPNSYVLRDQGGRPQLYALQRTEDGEARWVNLRGVWHPESPLLLSFSEVAEFMPVDGDSESVSETKERERRRRGHESTAQLDNQIHAALVDEVMPSVSVCFAREVFRTGEAITVYFVGRENGQDVLHELTGVSIDRTQRILNLHNPQFDDHAATVGFSDVDASVLVLTSAAGVYHFNIRSGRLTRALASDPRQADPDSVAEMIRDAAFNPELVTKVRTNMTGASAIGKRSSVEVTTYGLVTDPRTGLQTYQAIDLDELSETERGFPLPDVSATRKIKSAKDVLGALESSAFHEAFFKPAEETLISQLLIGGDEAVMTFVTDEGIILQLKMNADKEHPRERYLFSKAAHQMDAITDFRLLIPEEKGDGYVEIDNSILTVTSKRLPGEERNLVEMAIRPVGSTDAIRLELKEVFTSKTLQGTKSAGMPAFSFYGWIPKAKTEDSTEEQRVREAARAGLEATVQFFNFHKGPVAVEEVNEGDLSVVRLEDRRLGLEGFSKDADGRIIAGQRAVRRGANRGSYFELTDSKSGAKQNLITTRDGKKQFFPKRHLANEWTARRKKAAVEMQKIVGGAYASGGSLVERRPAAQPISGREVDGIHLQSAWARHDHAGTLDLVAGSKPKLSLFIYEDTERIDEDGLHPLAAARGLTEGRDIAAGDYYPFGSEYEVRLVEDRWQDPNGNWQRGKVRTFVSNKSATNLEQRPISPYGYNVFPSRKTLMGSSTEFSSQKVEAHYHETGNYMARKLMPEQPGSVALRAGVKADEIGWQTIFDSRGDASRPHLQALAAADGSFGAVSTYMGALHFISDTAQDDSERFVTHDAQTGTFQYSDSVLASLSMFKPVLNLQEVSSDDRETLHRRHVGLQASARSVNRIRHYQTSTHTFSARARSAAVIVH